MNSAWILGGAILILLIAYIGYGAWIGERFGLRPSRGSLKKNDNDYTEHKVSVAVGQQLSAITGLGTLQGTVAAAVFGWVPVVLWLIFGGIFMGAVHNFAVLFASVRHGGKSTGKMIERYLGRRASKWYLGLLWLSVVLMASILLEFAAGQLSGFTPGKNDVIMQNVYHGTMAMAAMMMIPISVFWGLLNKMKFPLFLGLPLGIGMMSAGIVTGMFSPLYLEKGIWIYVLLIYAAIAALLPMWMLLQSKNYLTSIWLVLLMAVAAIGIFLLRPKLQIEAFQGWQVGGELFFPYFIAVAAGCVLSGYQAMLNAPVFSRQLNHERDAKAVGMAPVLLQCLFGVIVMLTVCGSENLGNIAALENPLDLFTAAVAEVVWVLGVSEKWKLAAEIVILLILFMIVLSSFDTAVRVGCEVWCEFFSGKTDKKNVLQNRFLSVIMTVGAIYGVWRVRNDILWSILGIYLILLTIPVCFTVLTWLKQVGRSFRMLFLPLGAATAGAVIGVALTGQEHLSEVIEKQAGMEAIWNFVLLFLTLLAGVGIYIFIIDGVRAYMKKKKIIFATGNQGKMQEIREILGDLDAEILSLKDAGIVADIEEDGKTFEENAIIKAKAICEQTGCIVLADDSGLEIDYLNKEPGVRSARYMGESTSYTVKNNRLIQRLDGVPEEQRTARFVCVIAAAFPDGKIQTTRGTMEGYIGYEEKGENGFGYDPIFFLKEYNCTSAELSMEEKNKISHRGKALRAMKEKLR